MASEIVLGIRLANTQVLAPPSHPHLVTGFRRVAWAQVFSNPDRHTVHVVAQESLIVAYSPDTNGPKKMRQLLGL